MGTSRGDSQSRGPGGLESQRYIAERADLKVSVTGERLTEARSVGELLMGRRFGLDAKWGFTVDRARSRGNPPLSEPDFGLVIAVPKSDQRSVRVGSTRVAGASDVVKSNRGFEINGRCRRRRRGIVVGCILV